jgi:D-glycero-D-manno-heptose 1,7-bisphosphate phosphatase
MAAARAAFLDRDGTLVRDVGYARDPGQLELLPGVREAVGRIKSRGFLVVVVTNQSGIGRGYLSEEQYSLQIRRLAELLGPGAAPDAHYYCPHHPIEAIPPYRVDCDCRKPKPGLFLRAIQQFGIDPRSSFAIGDGERDLLAAQAAGIVATARLDPADPAGFAHAVEEAMGRIPA